MQTKEIGKGIIMIVIGVILGNIAYNYLIKDKIIKSHEPKK